MPLTLEKPQIHRVRIVDDDPKVREAYGYTVEDLNLQPDPVPGPLPDVDEFVHQTQTQSDAALLDFHLKVGTYAKFDGALPAAMLYKKHFPAVLCTRWAEADIDDIRPLRKFIPAMLRPDDLDPDSLAQGFERCMEEFKGKLPPSRRLWRTLIRVEDIDPDENPRFFYVVIPAWEPKAVVRLKFMEVPDEVKRVGGGST